MIWLLLSITASSLIFVIFRLFPKVGAHTFPAIVINYFVAATCGFAMLAPEYALSEQFTKPWVVGGLIVGVLFITLFYLMAFTAQRAGVGVTSIATKMSLVIPVAWFMLTDPQDAPSFIKISAIVLAIFGVVLSSRKAKGEPFNWSYALFPVIIFIGSGIIDLVLGQFSHAGYLQSKSDQYLFAALPFVTSAVLGVFVLTARMLKKIPTFNFATLWSGTALGFVNFGSIYFLVRTFDAQLLDRSALIPVNNLGIVLLSALASLFIFGERMTRLKFIGLVLSVIAIGLLVFNRV